MTVHNDEQRHNPWRTAFNYGMLTGIVILYVGVVGMMESFQDREVVRDWVTLAQLLILIPGFVVGYLTYSRNHREGQSVPISLASGVVGGLLASLPTLGLLFLNTQVFDSMRSILVNVNNKWIDVVTFDNRKDLLLGTFYFVMALLGTSALGSVVASLPRKLSRALLVGVSVTLVIAIFGDTVGLVLNQLMDKETIDSIFRRGVLKQQPGLYLLGLSLLGAFIWSYSNEPLQARYQRLVPSNKRIFERIILISFLVLLVALPFIIGTSLSDAAVTIGLFVLMGLGLNIAIGLAGLLDLGYVTNYAVGAYVMAVLTSQGPLGQGPDWMNFWLVLPIAILAAMFAGFIFAVPVLKMRGDYLAIATLGFGEIIGKLAVSDWLKPIIGGAQGIQFIPKPAIGDYVFGDPEQLYYIVLVACLITLFVSMQLNNSRIGRQWMAIREDEDVASAMGINVARSKLLAFTLSAATGGLAGAIFASKVGAVFPNSFTVFISINVLSLIIVGGIGSNPGIFLGALVLIGMPELLREFSEYRFLLYGVLLIFMMVNRPEGLLPSRVRQRELHNDEPPPVTQQTTAVEA